MEFQVFHVLQPLQGQLLVHSLDVAAEMTVVRIGQFLQARASLEFLCQMKHAPQHFRESFVLQQILILQQPQKKIPLVHQKRLHALPFLLVAVGAIIMLPQTLGYFFELPIDGLSFAHKLLLYTFNFRVPVRQYLQEMYPDLTEECLYDHVHLFQPFLLFPDLEEAMYEQCNQQNFNEHKSDIAKQVDEDMMSVLKIR